MFKTSRSKKGFDPQKGAPGWWNRIRERAGVNVRWHDLRHTFASRWRQYGGDLETLQRLLGHAHINITMRYAHLANAAVRFQVRRVEEARALRLAQCANFEAQNATHPMKLDR